MRRAITAAAVLALVAASAAVPFASPASAEAATNFYVATTGTDANSCTTSDAPCLTVGAAVALAQTAITDGAIDVTVNIAAGTYPENVVIGTVASGHSLSLSGAAASTTTIQGDGTASVISVESGTVDISRLTITGGDTVNGGGIYNDGGTVTVSDSTVSGNTGTSTVTAQGGGGIYNNTGTLSVSDSTVSSNSVTGLTQSYGGGGGIFNNAGTLTVSGSTVSDNTAVTGYAGGIFNNTGTLGVSDSTLSGNSGYYVGGIHNRGTLTVSGSTLSGNTSTKNFGGGISNFGGTMTVSDSTLSGNTATNPNTGAGGAIYNKGPATVTNSTLSGNSAYQGGGIYTQSKLLTVSNSTLADNAQTYTSEGKVAPGGGIWVKGSPGVNISNSILSGSSCSQISTLVDGGYNVSDDGCFWTIGPTSIQDSTTIGLAALAANGSTGPQTMAIDSSSSAHHLVPTCTGTDERGMPRPGFGGTADCDAGAFELQGVAPTVTTDPQSQTIAIGSDATFTAAASGTPTPTVTWQVNTGSAWADVTGATSTTLTISNVTHAMSGNQYRAVFTNGVALDATTATATLTVPAVAPGAPTELAAVAGHGSASLSWTGTPTGSDGGSPVTGYNVYQGTAPGTEGSTPVNADPLSATATSYPVTGLTNGTAYYFTVKALNAVGSSEASNEATATPVAPSAPGTSVSTGGTASSAPSGTSPSPATPVIASVTSPVAGRVTFTPGGTGASQTGYTMLGRSFVITAPAASVSAPLKLSFHVDEASLPKGAAASALTVFRDGVAIPDCTSPGATVADPDPCVSSTTSASGVATVTVLSSHASTWTFGTKSAPAPSRIKVAGIKGVSPGGTEQIAVRVWSADGTFAANTPVTIAVAGANTGGGVVTTDANGFGHFTYQPTALGTDTVTATVGTLTGTATVHIVRSAQRPVLGTVSRQAGTVNVAVQTHPAVITRKVKIYAVHKVHGHKATLVYVGYGLTDATGRAHTVLSLTAGKRYVLKARMAGRDYVEHLSNRVAVRVG